MLYEARVIRLDGLAKKSHKNFETEKKDCILTYKKKKKKLVVAKNLDGRIEYIILLSRVTDEGPLKEQLR